MATFKKVILSFAFILLSTAIVFAQALNKNYSQKLSPELYELVQSKTKLSKSSSSIHSIQSVGQDLSGNSLYGVIIKTSDANQLKGMNVNINSAFNDYVTARVSISDIEEIINLNSISYIEIGETLYPTNDIANAVIGADLLHSGYFNSTTYKGTGVIVCIIDTGIDWDHEDFRSISDPTKSRIQYIWDQTITKTGGEQTPQDRDGINLAGLNYGVEYSKTNIEDELDGTPAGFVREQDVNGHGTHVAGSAAGNGAALATYQYAGIAPEADIVVVKSGNGSFPNTNIIDGLTYAKKIADQLGKPLVVNMSLGGQANAHDGTSALDQAVNSFVGAGKIAVISAGNDGSNAIHITGSVANGTTANIDFSVPGYAANGGTDNDYFGFNLWFDTNGSVSATVTSPNSLTATQNANTTATTETNDGSIYLSNVIDGNNSDREIYLYVDDNNATYPPASGAWDLAITNNSGSSMTYHGWLFGSSMSTTLTGGNSQYTVGSPGNSSSAITIGSFVSRWNWHSNDGNNYSYGGTNYSDDISSFSSIGPRRDGVQKPDIAAPGQAIISCLSSDSSPAASDVIIAGKYLKEQGTSMASPVTAGAVALLLQQNSSWTYFDIKSFLTSNANTDSYTGGGLPDYTWGYGKLNIFKSMVKAVNSGATVNNQTFAYDEWVSSSYYQSSSSKLLAVKFTPSFLGTITGFLANLFFTNNITSPLYGEIWTDNSGLPGSKLGSTVSLPASQIAGNTWNYIDMQSSGVSVNIGTDYHAVIYYTSESGNDYIAYDNGSLDSRSSFSNDAGANWTAFANDFRIRPVVTTTNSALPVELISFSASLNDNKVVLGWKTATEINNYGFQIERKNENNRSSWENIGFVKGAGSSNITSSYSFIDDSPFGSNKFLYRLKQIDTDGSFQYSPEINVEIELVEYQLAQNYPNPFNPVTTIKFQLPAKGNVKISVFNTLGEKVTELINGFLEAGIHKFELDGSKLASGIYFVKMESSRFSDVKKIMLLK